MTNVKLKAFMELVLQRLWATDGMAASYGNPRSLCGLRQIRAQSGHNPPEVAVRRLPLQTNIDRRHIARYHVIEQGGGQGGDFVQQCLDRAFRQLGNGIIRRCEEGERSRAL